MCFLNRSFKYSKITLEIKVKNKCYKLSVVAQACNSSILEVEVGKFQSLSGLCSKFEASQSCIVETVSNRHVWTHTHTQ